MKTKHLAVKNGRALIVAATFLAAGLTCAFAQTKPSPAPGRPLPNMTVAPEGSAAEPPASATTPSSEESPAPEAQAKPTPAPAAPKKVAAQRHAPMKFQVEPAKARVRLKEETWLYEKPSVSSKRLQRLQAEKFVQVTGSTRYFLRVELKEGKTGYVRQTSADLIKPTDKMFLLTSNTPVLDAPNRWGKKLSEVHKGHNVHVTGVALDYAKIKMKSGLDGFITMKALE